MSKLFQDEISMLRADREYLMRMAQNSVNLVRERDELQRQVNVLTAALRHFSDSVDEQLLLDEGLHTAWEVLRAGVIEAREVLGDTK